MLTEFQFKEIYGQAERLRARVPEAAAELFLFLFDNGRTAGGYGVVRLSFVLGDLAALADLANPHPEPYAKRIRLDLEKRRDEREELAKKGEAGFTELQELVALNQALNQPLRTRELAASLRQAPSASPELAEEERIRAAAIAEVSETLAGLIAESGLPRGAEEIALQYEGEQLKRKLLELREKLEGIQPRLAGLHRRTTQQLAALAAEVLGVVALADEIRARCLRHRAVEPSHLPRSASDKRELVELAQATLALLDRHAELNKATLPLRDRQAALALATSAATIELELLQLSNDLQALFTAHQIGARPLRDQSQRDQLLHLARDTAARIAEIRIATDFPRAGLALPEEYQVALEKRIVDDGLLAYESLLRIGEEARADQMGAWMLSFRQNAEMYSRLAEAAKRAGKPERERRFREQAQRLSSG